MEPSTTIEFDKACHVKYWKRCSTILPEDYTTGDGARISLGFFIVAALDLLGILESSIPESERRSWANWIYSCQIPTGGFRGFPGTNLGVLRSYYNLQWDPASLPNTYLALVTLLVLGDDLGRVKRKACLIWLKRLQRDNGSFGEFLGEDGRVEGRDDLRQCYCAAGISYILQEGMDDFKKPVFDEEGLARFISNCQSYDGGYGQAPLREPHSGTNFCAIAALSCLRLLHNEAVYEKTKQTWDLTIEKSVDWMLNRQTTWVDEPDSSSEDEDQDSVKSDSRMRESQSNKIAFLIDSADEGEGILGFNGRCGKIADTCYCYWNGGGLAILQKHRLVESQGLRKYLVEKVQHFIGGFSKVPGHVPDLMHSYLGLAALALYDEPGLKSLNATFCVSQEAMSRLANASWRK